MSALEKPPSFPSLNKSPSIRLAFNSAIKNRACYCSSRVASSRVEKRRNISNSRVVQVVEHVQRVWEGVCPLRIEFRRGLSLRDQGSRSCASSSEESRRGRRRRGEGPDRIGKGFSTEINALRNLDPAPNDEPPSTPPLRCSLDSPSPLRIKISTNCSRCGTRQCGAGDESESMSEATKHPQQCPTSHTASRRL